MYHQEKVWAKNCSAPLEKISPSKHTIQRRVLPSHPEQLLPKSNYRGCKYICCNGWYHTYNYKQSIYVMNLWTNKVIKGFETLDSREGSRFSMSYSHDDSLSDREAISLMSYTVNPHPTCHWVPQTYPSLLLFCLFWPIELFLLLLQTQCTKGSQKQQPNFVFRVFKSAGQTPSLNLFTIDFSINKEIYLCLSLIRDKTVSINKFETTNLRPKANSLEKCGNCMTKYHKSTIPSLNCMFQNSEFFWF